MFSRPSWATLTSAVACLSSPVLAQTPREEGDLMIYSLVLEQRSLNESLPGFAVPGSALVPFGELCRALTFGIRVDGSRNTAEGFFLKEGRRFHLDAASGTVEVEGIRKSFDRTQVELRPDDLYVDLRLVQAWLPVDFHVDPNSLSIRVTPRERLPVQDQWEREKRLSDQGTRGQEAASKPLPIVTPYGLIDVPILDQTLEVSRLRGSQRAVDVQGSTYLAGDLLWMSSSTYFSVDANGRFQNFRETLFREDPDGKLLGLMHAREVVLGDIYAPPLDLLGSSPQGWGFQASSYPTFYRSAFDSRSFRGNLPPGWSVELFQNGAFLGFRQFRPDGLYEFLAIPLRFGLNDFRLIFHGPEGQRRVEAYRLDLSDAQPPAGAFYYRILGLKPRQTAHQQSSLEDATDAAGFRLESDYGLSKTLAINSALTRQGLKDGLHTFGMAGIRGAWPFLSLQANAAQDAVTKGRALQALLRTGYGYNSLTLRHVELQDFVSSAFSTQPGEDPLKSRTSVDFSGNWRSNAFAFQAGVQSGLERTVAGNLTRLNTVSFSGSTHNWSVTNNWTWRTQALGSTTGSPFEGLFMLSHERGDLSLRGEMAYARREQATRLDTLKALVEFRPTSVENIQASLERDSRIDQTRGVVSYFKFQGRVGLGLQAEYSRGSGLSVKLSLQASVGREPRTGRWAVQALPMAAQGLVSAQAYVDANDNGRMDPDEWPVEAVEYSVDRSPATRVLDDPKVGFLGYLGRNRVAMVGLDTSSLEDPYLKPKVAGFAITPRPGKVIRLEFPLMAFGEITGTTYRKKDGQTQPLPGLEVELVTLEGELRKTLRSSFDAFFDFLEVPPGDYLLRVSPGDCKRLGLVAPAPRPVKILPTGSTLDGLDLIVEPLPKDPPPSK